MFLIFENGSFNRSYVITYCQQSLKVVAVYFVLVHSQTIILMDVRAIMVRYQAGKILLSKASRTTSFKFGCYIQEI